MLHIQRKYRYRLLIKHGAQPKKIVRDIDPHGHNQRGIDATWKRRNDVKPITIRIRRRGTEAQKIFENTFIE